MKRLVYPIDESAGFKCVYRKKEYQFPTKEEAQKFARDHHGTVIISKWTGEPPYEEKW